MTSCPSDAVWMDLAAGLEQPESEDLLAHASECSRCAGVLAECVRVLSGDATEEEDAMLESLETGKPDWQYRMAESLAGDRSRRRVSWTPMWWAAAAAVLVALMSTAIWFSPWRSRRSTLDLLAQAYSKRRVVELRIGAAAFSPVRIERGGEPDRPAELNESQAAIQRHIESGAGSDPFWLDARGRAELLERHYDEAIRTLRLAADLAGSAQARRKTEILTDLATAYFERAEAQNRAIDYSLAADLLSQAIRSDGSFAPAFYNRAIVYEREFLYPNAASDWKRYLELDPRGAWADDARRRLAAVEKKLRASLAGDSAWADLAEAGLRRVMESGWSGPEAKALAARLARENQDRWLADALRTPPGTATETLAALMASQMATRIEKFPAELQTLDALASRGLPAPLQVWLSFERLFRVTHSPHVGECIAGMDDLLATCRRNQYAWFLAQTLLERSTCETAQGNLAAAEASDREAAEVAQSHSLPVTQQRALGFLSLRLAHEGRYREAANTQRDSLNIFWARPYPLNRAQEIYNNMDWVDEGLGRFYSAKAAAEAAALLAHSSGAAMMEAVNRARAAGYAERVGLRAEAFEQYSRSRSLFDSLPENDSTNEYRAFAEAFMAEASGSPEPLGRFESVVLRSADPIVAVPYLRSMATLAERSGDLPGATGRLMEAVHRMTPAGRPVTDRAPARRWRLELEETYRQLVWVELRQGNVSGAYQHWQELLAEVSALKGYRHVTQVAAPAVRPAALLTFARLQDRYGLWIRRESALDFQWVAGSAADLDVLARSFAALSAQPGSTWDAVRAAGGQLRACLLDAALRTASEDVPLLIQPDGELARLPWAALPLASGAPMGERFMIAVAPLPIPESAPAGLGDVALRKALFISATVIDPSLAAEYPPLPGIAEEMEAARQAFPQADSLEGAQATVANIELRSENADILHFAGHAMVRIGEPRLLAAPDTAAADADAKRGLWNARTASVRPIGLAVLSACSTARYEEEESTEPQDLAGMLLADGARQVLGSHWNADSAATSDLMQTFYRGLAQGHAPIDSLRAAVRHVRRERGWENPYYWAAFSLFVR